MNMSCYKNMFLKCSNKYFEFINKHQKITIFLFFFVVYNLNFRNISSGDNVPASLIPFAILETYTPYLDSYIPYFEMRYESTYFLLNSHDHFVSFFPIVTPVLVTPLYVIPYLMLKLYDIGFSIYDPHLYLFIDLMEKISSSIVASLSCVFIFLTIKKMFNDKIAWISAITFGLATNTWSTSSQALWQHGTVELLLVIMIYLVILIEKEDSNKNTIYLGLLSGLFIFNRPPDSVLLIPIIYYAVILKKKGLYYCLSLIASSVPFVFFNICTFGSFFGGYNQNIEILTMGTNIIVNTLGLLFSPNRGLFVYSPILIFSLLGMYRVSIIQNKNIRAFLNLFFISLFLNIMVYASFDDHWWGGFCYGPRFLSGMLPIIVIYLAVFLNYVESNFLPNGKKIFATIFLILFITSVFVQVVGAFYSPNGNWDLNPNVDFYPERLWEYDNGQIITTYKAGTVEPYFLQYIQIDQKDIVNNGVLIYGWQGLELLDGVPTRWMTNNGTISIYFQRANDATITFSVMPFDNLKHLQIKVNGNLIKEVEIDKLTRISFNTSFKQGKNQIVFYSPEGCKRPIDIPESNSIDSRSLSFAFQNIIIENSNVIIFASD